MFTEKDHSNGFSNKVPKNKDKYRALIHDLENPDKKIEFNGKSLEILQESEVGNGGFCLKSSKIGSSKGTLGNLGSEELTLSYLCDNSKIVDIDKENSGKNLFSSLEKAKIKGKEVIFESSDDDRLVERDFLQINEGRGSKREVTMNDDDGGGDSREKKAKVETLNLSLGLPSVSLHLNTQNPLPHVESSVPPTWNRSIQSLAPSNTNTKASSDDYTASLSYSYSRQFSHNPSCSLSHNSAENYEYSNGSHRRENDQIWYCGEGTNGSVHSRFKPILDGPSFSNNTRYPISQRTQNKDANNSFRRTSSSENLSFFPSELPARQRKDQNSSDSRVRALVHKVDNNDTQPEKILWEIISESIPSMSQRIQELPTDTLETVLEYLKNLINSTRKKDELVNLQICLDKRLDLTPETLLKSHKTHLSILVTVKTGLVDFLPEKNILSPKELSEIFFFSRCKNVNCKSLLPVDDCDCKICSTKKGFCSACMCPVCLNFDCATNTCSWVGCDVCSHWCHADCALQMNLIKPGPSLKGGVGKSEMQFHCVGCDHASEMFGFVKDVFMACGKDWGNETLMKELDCVRKIFQNCNDIKGKDLYNNADEMHSKLEKRLISASVACNNILQFFENGVWEINLTKDAPQSNQKAEIGLPPAITPLMSAYNMINSNSRIDIPRPPFQAEPKIPLFSNKDEYGSLESIVRFKEAEARIFQNHADSARKDAEKYRQIVQAKREEMDEEFKAKVAKICLREAEEKKRRKSEELKILQNAHDDYDKMKMRMRAEIAVLLERLEATKQQWV